MDNTLLLVESLSKNEHKKWEVYAILRIWNLLNDQRVAFVLQQCVFFDKETLEQDDVQHSRFALADLYLPQLNYIIEIDEIHHLSQKEEDEYRAQHIKDATNATIRRINCADGVDKIHEQIDNVVSEIKSLIQIQDNNGGLKVYDRDMVLSANYHIQKGYLDANERDCVGNQNEAFAIFGGKPSQHGGQHVPGLINIIVWCPDLENKDWKNVLSKDELFIEESAADDKENKKHYAKHCESNEVRIVFAKMTNVFGIKECRFIGLFRLNKELTKKKKIIVWERFSTYCDLHNLFQLELFACIAK